MEFSGGNNNPLFGVQTEQKTVLSENVVIIVFYSVRIYPAAYQDTVSLSAALSRSLPPALHGEGGPGQQDHRHEPGQ